MATQSNPASKLQHGFFEVDCGQLYFECSGSGGDAIVFLHGFGLDARMWTPQFESLQSAFRVIRYDFRGFGRSSPVPDCAYSHEEDLKALLSYLGVRSAHVVGLSMGGRFALRFAAAYPEGVKSLVLADAGLDDYLWSDDWLRLWQSICDSAKAGLISEAKRQWFEHPLFRPALTVSACASLLRDMIGDYSGWHWHNRDTARLPVPPLAERLHEIPVPSLVITGSLDLPDFQTIAGLLARALPASSRKILEGSGHLVNLEAPHPFNEALREFFCGLEGK